LRVDFLPAAVLGLRGRLGLTRAPGRWAPGRSPDSDARLREDLEAIAAHGARLLVTLVEPHELSELGDVAAAARGSGLRWIHFPIPDVWVPSDLAATRRLVARMLRALGRGDVVVHCWGGLGRAGTIAACCLAARGLAPADAIAAVRAVRPGAVEVPAQERFVETFGAGAPRRG
jgi:ADP-ribosyl-[dinitrogen reductase] hydrolase